jgi:hypothetical protein
VDLSRKFGLVFLSRYYGCGSPAAHVRMVSEELVKVKRLRL